MYLRSNLEYLLKIKDSNAYRLQIEANIPQPTIQRILTGKTDNPRQETLKNLSAWSCGVDRRNVVIIGIHQAP